LSVLLDPPRRFLAVFFGISAEQVIGVGVEGREDPGKKEGVVSPDAASSCGMSCSTSSSAGAMKGEVDGETSEKGEEIASPLFLQ